MARKKSPKKRSKPKADGRGGSGGKPKGGSSAGGKTRSPGKKKKASKKKSSPKKGKPSDRKKASVDKGKPGAGKKSAAGKGKPASGKGKPGPGKKPSAKAAASKKKRSAGGKNASPSTRRPTRGVTADLERFADAEEEQVQERRAGRQRGRVDTSRPRTVMFEPDVEDDDRSVVPLPWDSAPDQDDDEDDQPQPRRGRPASTTGRDRRPGAKTGARGGAKDVGARDTGARDAAVAKAAAKKVSKKTYPKLADKGLDRLLDKLDRARQPLFKEWREVIRAVKNDPSIDDEPHTFCTRKYNQMRITDLEALSIARAFREDPGLGRRRRDVKDRIAEEIRHLKKGRRRQNFTCPLLDGENCMVHQSSKPIGCLAWQPAGEPSEAGWRAFNQRNHYNDRMVNIDWDIAAIPLMLEKYIDGDQCEPGQVKVSEPHRPRKRHDSDSTEGAGRRGAARLSAEDLRRVRLQKERAEKRSTKKKATKKSTIRTTKKKRGKKKSSRKSGVRGSARNSDGASETWSSSSGGRKKSAKKASGRRRTR